MTDENEETEHEDAPRSNRASAPIVGIGASAGGIDALRRFFPAVSPDAGLTFVVVQHLAPEHHSTLADLLARCSRVPVTLIEEDTEVGPNHVFVLPQNASLTIRDGRLHLTRPQAPRGLRTPINDFFMSLAEDQGENAACAILSGTGSDGTLGLRAIKEHGGLTLAQTAESAEYDGMMRSAVATGLVDFVLPVDQMPAKLADYFGHLRNLNNYQPQAKIEQDASSYLAQICALLTARTGHNFGEYKENTVLRRVRRRMQILQIAEMPALIEHLRREPRELDHLFQDLLIGVTRFFRDASAFKALEREVLPKLFKEKASDEAVRVWVPGCSTGEEAYSIAILLREHLRNATSAPRLQVFATDIDEQSLEVARVGRYPMTIAQDVPPERLERHFVREDGTYRVISDLHEICLFSAHNLLRDPPFSRLDMISCRNLLIYFNPDLQARVIPLFHYALHPGGYLFLGASENVSRHGRLFANGNKSARIFRQLAHAGRRTVDFPLTPVVPSRRRAGAPLVPATPVSLMAMAERQILDRYAPAFVVVNSDGEVLRSSGRTGKFLELPIGAPDTNIFSMARREFRIELRAAIREAVGGGQVATRNNLSIDANGGHQGLNLIVQPLRQTASADALCIVIFQATGGIRPDPGPESAEISSDALAHQLELELRATKERLHTSTEELESSNEELMSANEELSSINEELQSSNEELETSRQELQSTNEELHTVNSELNHRIEEFSRANSDIKNLLENTQIATVFLDRELNVKSFTPAAKELFRLVESDAGRPIEHVRARFTLDTMQEDLERVLRTLVTIERYVGATDTDSSYFTRMLPYRTVDEVIAGVVITFTDITRITAAETRIDELTRDLRNRLENLETVLDLVPIAILILEDGGTEHLRVNRYGARFLGEEDQGKGMRRVFGEIRMLQDGRELTPEELPLQRALRTGEPASSFEGRLVRNDGSTAEVMMSATPLFDEANEVRGAIAAIVDISQRKRAEAQQEKLLHELQHRVKNILATVSSLASRMLGASTSIEEFSEPFLARLRAMGTTNELLSAHQWEGAELRNLITEILAPYTSSEKDNVALHGPQIFLKPNAAETLGLSFYELASNAAKYGALAAEEGRIEISWHIEEMQGHKKLVLTWLERNGPPVEPQIRNGFGTSFIRRCIEYELGGTVELTLPSDGLRCGISFAMHGNV